MILKENDFNYFNIMPSKLFIVFFMGAQWLSGIVLDLRLKSRRFKHHLHHCVVSLSKTFILA